MVGKWHLGFCNKKYWPNYRGFDSFYGFFNGGQGYYDHARYALTGIEGYDFRDGEVVAWETNGTYSTCSSSGPRPSSPATPPTRPCSSTSPSSQCTGRWRCPPPTQTSTRVEMSTKF